MQIALLGLGQIGGSVARAALAAGFASRVSAWTPAGTGPDLARADGIMAVPSADAAIRGADLIVLAAPPLACLDLLDDLAGPLSGSVAWNAVITDVASTKGAIARRARGLGLRFVGGHPMAGAETAGYAASDPGLFADRPWIVVPAEPADGQADARVIALAEACGARPIVLSAEAHDDAVAAISHLPLLLSAALVEAISGRADYPLATTLAAGGWASMTRLARGDAAMGAGIVATNHAAIARGLDDLEAVLAEWRALLGDDAANSDDFAGSIDAPAVERRLGRVRSLVVDEDMDEDMVESHPGVDG